MEKRILSILYFVFFTLILCSCTPLNSNDQRIAICKELKSKMIFNGNTSNNREAEIENSENALLQRQYEKYHCDEI